MTDSKNKQLFPAFGSVGQIASERQMSFCMITNMGIRTEIPEESRRAEIYVRDPSIDYVGIEENYIESGLSSNDFQTLVLIYIGQYLKNEYVRNLQFYDEGCALFEADDQILGSMKDNFPRNRFCLIAFDSDEERNICLRDFLTLKKASKLNKNLIFNRPHLDS